MATIKLGAIISSIAGSIVGTTFRRGNNFTSIYNKQGKQMKSKNSVYNKINKISNIVKTWSYMSQDYRDTWVLIAQNFTFKDKFNNPKTLTARQLFIKLNSQLIPTNTINLDASRINNIVNLPLVGDVEQDIRNNYINIFFLNSIDAEFTFFKILKIQNLAKNYISKSTKTDFVLNLETSDYVNIYEQIKLKYGEPEIGQIFKIIIINCNSHGFLSSQVNKTITITP